MGTERHGPTASYGSEVKEVFFLKQLFFRFDMVFIRNTAVYRTNGGALGFFVKTLALGAFIGHDVVHIVIDRFLGCIGIVFTSAGGNHLAGEGCAVGETPFFGTFVDRVIGALGLAGPAVDAFVGYLDRHSLQFLSPFLCANKSNATWLSFPSIGAFMLFIA